MLIYYHKEKIFERTDPTKRYVEVIIPLYNGRDYCHRLIHSLEKQLTDFYFSYYFVITDTGDDTKSYLEERGMNYTIINEFNHALTREKALMHSKADVVVMATQDVVFEDSNALQRLVECINGDVKFAYLRQVCRNWTIERYTRQINYPKKSSIRTAADIKTMGLNAFFASDACAAYDVEYFQKMNGYDGKALPTNEDMYYVRKVLLDGKKVAYCASSYAVHTHKFTLKQIHDRYALVGRFFAQNPEFKEYSANSSGAKLALKTLGRILITFNIPALFMFLPNMYARYKGKKDGEAAYCAEQKK